jgi:hypothetical protein
MIKIERSTAVNPTIVRNGVRQPVTLNMTVTAEELESLTADSGSIIYSVDETEVKTVDFQPKQSTTAPVVESIAVAVADTVVTTTVAKPIIQPARKTTKATQA